LWRPEELAAPAPIQRVEYPAANECRPDDRNEYRWGCQSGPAPIARCEKREDHTDNDDPWDKPEPAVTKTATRA
jgi:hypothetical protein